MGLWSRIFGSSSKADSRTDSAPRPTSQIKQRYDAAVTNDDNRRHWANADGLAPDAGANPGTRAILRNRGRYEQLNNPYTDGMLQTLASDTIGRRPYLQMLLDDTKLNSYIEYEFDEWAKKIRLGKKLRLMIETRAASGEPFGILSQNPKLTSPVKLDLTVIEADRVATPDQLPFHDPRRVDGIVYDAYGNPTEYHILKEHPGDTRSLGSLPSDYERVPARYVLHLYKMRRPEQKRGIPQITSSLPLFAERRSMRQSIVMAARAAADLGGVMLKSNLPPDDSTPAGTPFESVEYDKGVMVTLPDGYDAQQLKPEQPGTTYSEFDDKLLNESARPLGMPFNIAACNSSKYNYASGRLDHQTYDRSIDTDHDEIELEILDRIFEMWLEEARQIDGYLPLRIRYYAGAYKHRWLWRGRGHSDPVKEATAQKIRLASRMTTWTDELAAEGKDAEAHFARMKQDEELLASYGLRRSEPLNGPQVSSASEVLINLRAGILVPEAATMLLVSLGVSQDIAKQAVDATVAAGTISLPTRNDNAKPANAAPGRNGTGRLAMEIGNG